MSQSMLNYSMFSGSPTTLKVYLHLDSGNGNGNVILTIPAKGSVRKTMLILFIVLNVNSDKATLARFLTITR
jgi:hypothetical protein